MSGVTISFVDVGQGDCTTIVDTNGLGILIDCPAGADKAALQELDVQKCTSLRAAIVTHSDQDHAGGLLDVLERLAERFDGRVYFNVDSLQATPVAGPDRKIEGRKRRAFLLRVLEYMPRLEPVQAGNAEQAGMSHWRFVSPTYGEVIRAWNAGNPNLASAIVIITAFGKNVIISGDAQLSAWESISASLPPESTVRWPHHGGKVSEGDQRVAQERLFEICRPVRVVVSVGRNTFGHPFEEFFAARQTSGVRLICTEASDKCVRDGGWGGVCAGTIRLTLTADGETLSTGTLNHAARIREFGAARCLDGVINTGSA